MIVNPLAHINLPLVQNHNSIIFFIEKTFLVPILLKQKKSKTPIPTNLYPLDCILLKQIKHSSQMENKQQHLSIDELVAEIVAEKFFFENTKFEHSSK